MVKNIKLLVYGAFMICMGLVSYSCSDDESIVLSGNDILSFSIEGSDVEAVIDANDKSVLYVLPEIPENFQLQPKFTLSEGAWASVKEDEVVSGMTPVNFSHPITFKVTAGNGDRAYWDINVSNTDYTNRWGLGSWLTEEKSNNGTNPDGFYLEQQNTGTYWNNNCGPAVAVMAAIWSNYTINANVTVEWARGIYPTSSVDEGSVSWYPVDVRNLINYSHNGQQVAYLETLPSENLGSTLEEMKAEFPVLVKNHIDAGELVIVCLSMSYISQNETGDSETRVDKYYDGNIGHFLLIKGYKVVDGELFFECHDPWGLSLTYEDGTPVGANRYYRAEELALAGNHNYYAVIVRSEI